MDYEIIRNFERLEELQPVWERLWQSDSNAEIFQHFSWIKSWWDSYGVRYGLCVPVIYEEGTPALIVPPVHRDGILTFLGSPQADYCDIISSHPQPAQLLGLAFEALLNTAPEWKHCTLAGLAANSQLVTVWNSLPRELRRLMRLQVSDRCPTILLGENRIEILESLLAGKHMRRRLQKLQKAGSLRFRHIEERADAQLRLAQFFQSHRRRCALLAKVSCFEEAEMREMMRSLVGRLDLKKELRFGVLELDGRPLAWSLGFQAHDKFAYYQQTFDVDAEQYNPGEVLLHFLLRDAKSAVKREVDLSGRR